MSTVKITSSQQTVKQFSPKPGDVFLFETGSYPGQDLSGLSGVTLEADSGAIVNFTSPFSLGNTASLSLIGFIYSGVGNAFNHGGGNNVNLTVTNASFGKSLTNVFEGGGSNIVYTGTPQSCLYYNLVIQDFVSNGAVTLYNGTWSGPKTYENVVIGLTLKDGFIYNDQLNVSGNTSTKVFGNSLYKVRVLNVLTSGPTSPLNDVGFLYILSGNVQICGFRRLGGYGYIGRIWQVSIGGIASQDSCVINSVDYGTNCYGSIDIRIDPGLLQSNAPIPLRGGNFDFVNNTCGRKEDKNNGYVTNAVIQGDMVDDLGNVFTTRIVNNFAYAAWQTGMNEGSSLLKPNYSKANVQLSDNVDINPSVGLPAGYIQDEFGFVPVIGGPLNGKAVAVTGYTLGKDIGGIQAPLPVVAPTPRTIKSVTYSDGTTQSF